MTVPLALAITQKVQNFANDWQSVFAILFMLALVFVLWRTLKLMPQTKPVQITPEANLEVGWEDIAGVDEAKAELREVVEFLRDPKPFARLGASVPRGVLLHGPPGTGKTLLAKAVAHESGAQFFSQSASSFVEMFAGLGAARIRRLFREARKAQPAISPQPIGGAASGLISTGLVFGMNRINMNTDTTSRPMKMIGSHACRKEVTSG